MTTKNTTENGLILSIIKEGKAEVNLPSGVFYNKVQEFNRDLTIAVINTFFKDDPSDSIPKFNRFKSPKIKSHGTINILEALAASGLRSIRFGYEIDVPCKIVANDIDPRAVESINANIKLNKLENIVSSSCADAAAFILSNKGIYDVIDIDPYGSAMEFIDPAVQSVVDGGLLCFTCTDLGVLCGNRSEVCYARYNSMPLNISSCHEMALRIVMRSVASAAAKHRRLVTPLISVYVDFYIRIFVTVRTCASKANELCLNISSVYNCFGCSSHWFQPAAEVTVKESGFQKISSSFLFADVPNNGQCTFCGTKVRIGGPIWTSPLHSPDFVKKLQYYLINEYSYLGTIRRLNGMTAVVSEELLNIPLFYELSRISSVLSAPTIPGVMIKSALLNAGYHVSDSHAAPNSLKTDAPLSFIWDIMRTWAIAEDCGSKKRKLGSPAENIISLESKNLINWDLHANVQPISKSSNMLRYQLKPEPNWGPQSRPC